VNNNQKLYEAKALLGQAQLLIGRAHDTMPARVKRKHTHEIQHRILRDIELLKQAMALEVKIKR